MPGPDPATEAPRCPDCGAEVLPPGRFCVHCGASVGEAAAEGDSDDACETEIAATDGSPHDEEPAATTEGPGSPDGSRRGDDGAMPPPASGRGATLRCPSCGEVNARARELCHACGVDLDPTDRTSVPARAPRRVPERRRRLTMLRRWWVVPVAIAVLVGAIVAGLAGLQVGPFAPAPEPLAVASFPADRYPDPATPLTLVDIGTLTSAAPEGDRLFTPDRMVDPDPTTAWRGEDPALPEGVRETIDLTLAEPAWLDALVVANGDHLDAEAYEASGRIQQLELWVDGDLHLDVTLLDLGRQRQVVTLPEPLLTTAVRLVVVGTVPGVEHPEPAVSGLQLRGHVADPADADLARDRAAQRPAVGVVAIG